MPLKQQDLLRESQKYASLEKTANFGIALESIQHRKKAFLCHSHKDVDLVKGLVVSFREKNVDLYVDWLDTLMPETTNKETAKNLQQRIKQADMFLFLATRNSMSSRWCPWEIGYADGVGKVPHILPTIDKYSVTHGNEYLTLYPRIDLGIIENIQKNVFAIFAPGENKGIVL